MASPHTKNGFTRIAHELLEAFGRFKLTANEYQIVFIILRKTYGFNKTEDIICVGQFAKATGLVNSVIYRCLSSLQKKNVITKRKVNGRNLISIQINYELWENNSSTATTVKINQSISVIVNSSKTATKNNSSTAIHNKKERKKENIQSIKTSNEILNEFQKAGLNTNLFSNLKHKYITK